MVNYSGQILNGSSQYNLSSERFIVREISALTLQTLSIPRINESSSYELSLKVLKKGQLILDNLRNREGEPEDLLLGASSLLQELRDRAIQENASLDWERELDEL